MTVRKPFARAALVSRREATGETGQIAVLAIGYVVLCLLVAGVVTGVSAVYLEHKRLLSVADGAAQAAADSFTLADVSTGSGPPVAILASERVRATVQSHLGRDPAAARIEGLTVAASTGSPDGRSAKVTLSAVARLPLVGIFMPEGVPIEATSTGRARLAR
ncbi:pilus assembly protein TadG-related protein [Sinomonas albida]|uniref:pilus assembly protein TadG-related protein n=1 Tax=Sinomonas albida TaxID=369942 RepID=UPI0010A85E9A|nr:pilus assembly protein TadG-related protein [Sinomonas albida]